MTNNAPTTDAAASTAQSAGRDVSLYSPANADELAAYRRGVESGAMKSATPNVVAQLLVTIEGQARRIDALVAAGRKLPNVCACAEDSPGTPSCCYCRMRAAVKLATEAGK